MPSNPPSLEELENKARNIVEIVKDNPDGRLQLRKDFYRKYGHGEDGGAGFGSSELAFLEWEIHRDALNPLENKDKPGSPWWRKVNGLFIYYSTLAALIEEEHPGLKNAGNEVEHWREFISNPTSKIWYRAHNASIVRGYLESKNEAEKEDLPEQLFINMVLYRVLFAEAMVEGVTMGRLGEILANPKLPSVDLLVHIPDFYPSYYPLTQSGIAAILHKSRNLEEYLVEILDDSMIIPHLSELYKHASEWLGMPELTSLLKSDIPVYPNLTTSQGRVLVHRNLWEIIIHWIIHRLFKILKTKF
jgi:hypothetical protein